MVSRVRAPLLGAGACALAFLLLLALAYGSGPARRLDASALLGFVGLYRPLFIWLGDLGDALPVAAAALILAGVALARSQPRIALAVLCLVGATSV
jgi:membrane-associated phospholipid phosphatase